MIVRQPQYSKEEFARRGDEIYGNVLDMGMGCPESLVGLNPAIQIPMSSALPSENTLHFDIYSAVSLLATDHV